MTGILTKLPAYPPPTLSSRAIYATITPYAPGLIAVLVTLLLLPGSAFAFQFNAPSVLSNLLAEIEVFIENLFAPPAAHHTEPTASAASAAAAEPSPAADTPSNPQQESSSSNPFTATSTNATTTLVVETPPSERTVYLQPQTIERTVVQSAPLPDDLVHTSLLAELLAAFESKISAKISAVTTPPPFPQQVAANGNGVFSYGAAAAASSGGGGSASGVSLSDVNAMVAAAIQAALSAIDHLTANTVTATNATLTNATVTTLHVTGTATLDSPLSASSGGTGVSTAPSYGQLLLGQSDGTYALVATSSLGIPGGTGAWGAITGTLANQTDLQNTLNAKLSLAQWYATTSSALTEGNNLYFTNTRADARINATSSIGTLLAAPNLASVGTVTNGTWNAAAIGTPYGGTGWTNVTSGALLYGNGTGALATTSAGAAGNVLALLNGVPTWTASTTFGAGLTYAGGNVTLNTSGDWSGTLNGYSASQLIGLGFSTTSAAYYVSQNQGLAFSTTSVGLLEEQPRLLLDHERELLPLDQPRERVLDDVRVVLHESEPRPRVLHHLRRLLRQQLDDDTEDVRQQYVHRLEHLQRFSHRRCCVLHRLPQRSLASQQRSR